MENRCILLLRTASLEQMVYLSAIELDLGKLCSHIRYSWGLLM